MGNSHWDNLKNINNKNLSLYYSETRRSLKTAIDWNVNVNANTMREKIIPRGSVLSYLMSLTSACVQTRPWKHLWAIYNNRTSQHAASEKYDKQPECKLLSRRTNTHTHKTKHRARNASRHCTYNKYNQGLVVFCVNVFASVVCKFSVVIQHAT